MQFGIIQVNAQDLEMVMICLFVINQTQTIHMQISITHTKTKSIKKRINNHG